jgi:hypothetical protein
MKARAPFDGAQSVTLVATNSAVATQERLLSLYVFRLMAGPTDVAAVKELTEQWLACLRTVK